MLKGNDPYLKVLGCINNPKFEVLSDLYDRIVLDSGTGMGSSYAKFLQERRAKIISLDLSEYALKEHWLFPRNYENSMKIQGDFFDLPFKDSTIDVVVAYYFMADNPLFIEDEQVKKESFKRYISEVERVLIKDGVFIAFDPRILTGEAVNHSITPPTVPSKFLLVISTDTRTSQKHKS